MLYDLLKKCVSLFFNILNTALGGKLPPFGSAGVIVEDHDHYLVIELPDNRVVFPGGFMNWREHPKQAAEREGYEETGLLLCADSFINFYTLTSSNWRSMSNLSFVYSATVIGGALRNNAEGRPCWMHIDELRPRLSAHSLCVLNDYLLYRQQRTRSTESRELFPLAS